MTATAHAAANSVVPLMRYRNVATAINWLCAVFGFERQLVVPGDDDSVFYAQLTFGRGLVMVGPVRDSEFDKYLTQPDEIGGVGTQSCYIVVDDIDAHYVRAKAAGAEIVVEITGEDAGGRGYSCRDPEGHIWNFGTYDPWRTSGSVSEPTGPDALSRGQRIANGVGMAMAGALALVLSATAGFVYAEWRGPPVLPGVLATLTEVEEPALHAPPQPLPTRATLEAISELREEVARERFARQSAEQTVKAAQQQLANDRRAKDEAVRRAAEIEAELERAKTEHRAGMSPGDELDKRLTDANAAHAYALAVARAQWADERKLLEREKAELQAALAEARKTAVPPAAPAPPVAPDAAKAEPGTAAESTETPAVPKRPAKTTRSGQAKKPKPSPAATSPNSNNWPNSQW